MRSMFSRSRSRSSPGLFLTRLLIISFHQRVLCYRAQHHKHGPVLLLQFIQEAYQQRLPLALRSHWGSRDVVRSQHYHQRIQVIVALEFHHLDDLSHRGSSKGQSGSLTIDEDLIQIPHQTVSYDQVATPWGNYLVARSGVPAHVIQAGSRMLRSYLRELVTCHQILPNVYHAGLLKGSAMRGPRGHYRAGCSLRAIG